METLILCYFLALPAIVALILEETLPAQHKGEYCLMFCPGLGHIMLGLLALLYLLGLPFQMYGWAVALTRKEKP